LTTTDPLSHTIELTYDAGDLVTVTDPLSRTITRHLDSVGRVTRITDPLGHGTRYSYDNLNQPTSATDSLQGVAGFSYDENGNLLSVTDAASSTTSYEYDDMDRVMTRTDPLSHDDTYEYDLNGNLEQVTDRKGQVTSLTYDVLDRLTEVTYDDSSTTTYAYDSANRLTEVVDSVSGTITYDYDDLDRLTSETTPQGSVSYTYDDAGRCTSMTVDGQTAVNYTYDNANRLTQISQGSPTVTIAYDNANRRTSLTLPNGVITEYTYDAASQLTDLSYKYGTNVLGNLSYTFDAVGRRTAMGGSYARTGLPQTVNSATYNAANHQTAFGSLTLTYDLNGNLTGDGTNSYSWNARDQLVSISGGTTAGFSYDAFGRRTTKTLGSTTTTYLYDGENIAQELSGTTPVANLLNGGIDEVFTRSESSGTLAFLADGLGSTLGLSNSSGSLQTEYTYEPFGKTSATGGGSTNSSQYAGRENDGATGLHYYRARYYSPALQRFISEDPIGFAGGDTNLYVYVFNSPTNYTDPSGLSVWTKAVKIFTQGGELVASFRKPLSRDPKLDRIKDGIDEARRRGNDPRAVVQADDRDGAKAIADALDPNRKARGPEKHPGYPEHYNPKSGPYKDVHVQWDPPHKRLARILAPQSMLLSGRKNTTNAQFASAALWDVASTIDPFFLTDGLDWAFDLSCQ
jgi:RHS repeat-associated protein